MRASGASQVEGGQSGWLSAQVDQPHAGAAAGRQLLRSCDYPELEDGSGVVVGRVLGGKAKGSALSAVGSSQGEGTHSVRLSL